MNYNQERDRALAMEIAMLANQRIAKEKLMPVPEIYELWYVYYSKTKPEIVLEMDKLIKANKKITDAQCLAIHKRLLSDEKTEETVRRAGEQMQSAMTDVTGLFRNVKDAAHDYKDSLTDVTNALSKASTPEQISEVIRSAGEKTKGMIAQNEKLEAELLNTANIVAELRRDLESVRREALTDGLTGLANRKSFDAELLLRIEESKREHKTFTLLMVDIDHFKSFNDNFGHQVGDHVLRLVARTLKDNLKGRDYAARYGGEEFAILLPETGSVPAEAVGNFLRQAIASKDIINRATGESMGKITMSIGVAEYFGNEAPETLIDRADAALYAAKHQGRNQVIVAKIPK